MTLSPQQIRVLGALIEKEITTPDLYPLSLNSLQAACNQRSSREPVLDLTEDEVRTALHQLNEAGLAGAARGSLSVPIGRVAKFEHHARTALNLRRDEIAVLCLLLLRGPQTPGELRARADRLYSFNDLAAISSTLERLAAPPATESSPSPPPLRPLVVILPRQAGARESRYRHLLGVISPGTDLGIAQQANTPAASPMGRGSNVSEAEVAHGDSITSVTHLLLAGLEARIVALEGRVATLEGLLAPIASTEGQISPTIASPGSQAPIARKG